MTVSHAIAVRTMGHCSSCALQQELEREVRQALAEGSIGGFSPARNRPEAFLDAQGPSMSDSSPLTFASSQYSPSDWPQVPFVLPSSSSQLTQWL